MAERGKRGKPGIWQSCGGQYGKYCGGMQNLPAPLPVKSAGMVFAGTHESFTLRGTLDTGGRAAATGVNAATDAGRAAGDTVRAGAQ